MTPEEEFVNAVAYTQGQSLAHNFILREVLIALAQQSADPPKYISQIYDRVCSYSDQMASPSEKSAGVYAREVIDRFFSKALERVR